MLSRLSQFIVISLHQESVTSLYTVENGDQVTLCNYLATTKLTCSIDSGSNMKNKVEGNMQQAIASDVDM